MLSIDLQAVKRLTSDEAVAECFMQAVRSYLAAGYGRHAEISPELLCIIELCKHHRDALCRLAQIVTNKETKQRSVWLQELASPSTGEWAGLRFQIRAFLIATGKIPRPRYTPLFSHEFTLQAVPSL